MSAVDNTPTNRNFLNPENFVFKIKKTPNLNFFLQDINGGDMTLPATQQPNPLVKIPIYGDHIEFADLALEFKVDADLKNYNEIYNWLSGLGYPITTDQFADIEAIPSYSGDGITSDVSLITLNSDLNANYQIRFIDAFPVFLSGFKFNTTANDIKYVTAKTVFKYTYYTIEKSP
jgi:hypothetical protein